MNFKIKQGRIIDDKFQLKMVKMGTCIEFRPTQAKLIVKIIYNDSPGGSWSPDYGALNLPRL